jgi:hypothetical protein
MRLKHPYNKIHSRQTYLECPKTTSNKTNTPNDGPKEQLLFATIYATNSRNLCSECPSLIQFTDWEKAKGRGWMEKKAKMSEERVIDIVTWGVGTKFGGFDVHDIRQSKISTCLGAQRVQFWESEMCNFALNIFVKN